MDNFNLNNYNRVYFCGILGVSMQGLAKHCLFLGKKISGSDANCSAIEVFDKNVLISSGLSLKNIKKFQPDLVVYSSAISLTHKELIYAKKKNIKTIKRSELLGEILKLGSKSIAVSGCHGKTTITAMLAHVLYSANIKFTAFIGGDDTFFGNYFSNGYDFVLTEACEFKKNFLDLSPNYCIVSNIDDDHQDSFVDMQDRISTFKKFIEGKVAIINEDDINSNSLKHFTSVSIGIKNKAQYCAKNLQLISPTLSMFSLYCGNRYLCKITLNVGGLYNIYNALSCCALCCSLNIDIKYIKKGLKSFCGVKRRLQNIGKIQDCEVIIDYAHHPTEIACVLDNLKITEKDLVVFQPHTYSRTKCLMDSFVKVLGTVKNLVIYKTYPAREKFDRLGDFTTLYNNICNGNNSVKLIKTQANLIKYLTKKINFDRIIFLGAGDMPNKIQKIINSKKRLKNV